jgi:lysophospholipase L1-like esterase
VKKFFLVFALVAGLAAAAVGYQALRIEHYGRRTAYNQVPFERAAPRAKLKILFLGDSTAVGTGAASNTQSTAGFFGQDFPKARIVNFSRNGQRLAGLLQTFHPRPGEHYDLAVAQIGANDIMHFTSYRTIAAQINDLAARLKPLADTVVILHSGNVGLSPIFSWPFDQIFGWRSRKVREIYIQTAHDRGVLYVDLFSERSNDLFLKDIGRYYSPDLLHPSGEGYRWWYTRIRQTLNAAHVKLSDSPF